MALEIFSANQWHTFSLPDFTDVEKQKQIRNLSPFAVVVRASNAELDFIRARFLNLPITKDGLCLWRGWICEFILTNLSSEAL